MDNQVKLQFKNQDQKAVNMTGKTATLHFLNDNDSTVWFSRDATVVDVVKGIYTVPIYETDLLDLEDEYYHYSVNIEDDATGDRTLAYADDNYTVRGEIQLLSGHFPEFHASTNVALNNLYTATPYSPGSVNTTSIVAGDATTSRKNSLHTAQFYFSQTGFTGAIAVEATLDSVADFINGNWFTVETLTFTDQVATSYINWTGIHNFVRFRTVPSAGTITKILFRS
jgi:hypothetical protein